MRSSSKRSRVTALLLPVVFGMACTTGGTAGGGEGPMLRTAMDTIMLGRQLVISHACGDCHGGGDNPAAPGYLDGMRDTTLQQFRLMGFVIRPRNITPDDETGIGQFTERQIFNALRYGLRPSATPDVDITSNTPGQGNFPATPHYLSPVMPWASWRHMSDTELHAIAAYLKRGVKPSSHHVDDSEGPPDFWADVVANFLGPAVPAPFPTEHERMP